MKNFSKLKIPVFLLVLVIFTNGISASEIEVRHSVNLETILTLISITDSGYKYQQGYRHYIKTDMYIHFYHYRVMQAAKTTEMLMQNGFWMSSFALYSQCFSEFPDARRIKPYPDIMLIEIRRITKNKISPEVFLDNYFEQIRDFFKQTSFLEFFEKYSDFYDSHVEQVKEKIKNYKVTENLNSFFGYEPDKYYVVITAAAPTGFNFGGQLALNGEKEFYCFKGPDLSNSGDGSYTFSDNELLENIVLHEFAHSFIKPAVYRKPRDTYNYRYLYEYIKPNMERLLYPHWISAIEEHFVRAFEIVYYNTTERQDYARRLIKNYETQGFRLIYFIHDILKDFNQGEYAGTFTEVFSEMLKSLDHVKPVKIRFMSNFGFLYRVRRNRVEIARVVNGYSFDLSGVQVGDIIYSIDGERLNHYSQLNELFERLNRKEEGEKVKFDFIRNKIHFEVEIEVPFRYEWYFSPV
ncbi:DUF4932 domain-containing protein [candidate division KSB1 bacterium]